MTTPARILLVLALLSTTAAFQPAKPTKSKATKAPVMVTFTFEAHNEGSPEGPIYGDENLISLTIDSTGIHFLKKNAPATDKPTAIPWDQVSGWQPNNFTSRSPAGTAPGDYGIGLYQGARYFSFRTRNGHDYTAALKALRALAPLKERPGIG
jgi:hypothetical protein